MRALPCKSMPPARRAWPRRCGSSLLRTLLPWLSAFAPPRLPATGTPLPVPPLPPQPGAGRQASWLPRWLDGPQPSASLPVTASSSGRGNRRRASAVARRDDMHWMDGESVELLRYLGRFWSRHGSRVLLLGTLRSEGLEPKSQLSAQLADLGRDLPVTQVSLQPLSQAETLQLIQAIVGEGAYGTWSGGERSERGPARPSTVGSGALPTQKQETPLIALGNVLFAHTGGQPLYLLETLKLFREPKCLGPPPAPRPTLAVHP